MAERLLLLVVAMLLASCGPPDRKPTRTWHEQRAACWRAGGTFAWVPAVEEWACFRDTIPLPRETDG